MADIGFYRFSGILDILTTISSINNTKKQLYAAQKNSTTCDYVVLFKKERRGIINYIFALSCRREAFYNAPNCLRYFSEFAFTLAGGFMLKDFLKLAIAFFLSPLIA